MSEAPTPCPLCNRKSYRYRDGNWTERICWSCGMYNSDTPAFKESPDEFRDIVRKNARYFLLKYAYYRRGIIRSSY